MNQDELQPQPYTEQQPQRMVNDVLSKFSLFIWPRKPLSNPGGKGGVKGRVASRAGRSKGSRAKGRGRKRRGMED